MLEGLFPRTLYDFYVEVVCGSDTSAWAGPFTFATLDPCPDPSDLTVSGIGVSEATLAWETAPTVSQWTIQWGFTGFPLGNGVTTAADTNPYTIGFFPKGTTVDAYVQADCDSLTSEYVGPVTFTTVCPQIENFTATAAQTFAVLDWNNLTGVEEFQIEWGPVGFTPGTGTSLTTDESPFILEDLPLEEDIDIYVTTICADTVSIINGPQSVLLIDTKEEVAGVEFGLYPNPTTGETYVVVSETLIADVEISIMDVLGKIVFNQTMPIGTQKTQLDLSQLTKGQYFVSIEYQNGVITKKLTIQ